MTKKWPALNVLNGIVGSVFLGVVSLSIALGKCATDKNDLGKRLEERSAEVHDCKEQLAGLQQDAKELEGSLCYKAESDHMKLRETEMALRSDIDIETTKIETAKAKLVELKTTYQAISSKKADLAEKVNKLRELGRVQQLPVHPDGLMIFTIDPFGQCSIRMDGALIYEGRMVRSSDLLWGYKNNKGRAYSSTLTKRPRLSSGLHVLKVYCVLQRAARYSVVTTAGTLMSEVPFSQTIVDKEVVGHNVVYEFEVDK